MAALRLWEAETIAQMRMTEDDWGQLGIRERVRKVIGLKLSEWLGELEMRYHEK